MKITWDTFKKILLLIILSISFYLLALNSLSILKLLKDSLFKVSQVVWAFSLAYVINIPMAAIEKHVFDRPFFLSETKRNQERPAWVDMLKRPLSLLFIIIVLFLFVSFFIVSFIPKLGEMISIISNKLPSIISGFESWADGKTAALAQQFGVDKETFNVIDINGLIENRLFPGVLAVGGWLTSAASGIGQFLISLFIAILILLSKDRLVKQMNLLIFSFVSNTKLENMMSFLKQVDYTFKGYFCGATIDSFILAVLTYLAMWIFGLDSMFITAGMVFILAFIPIVGVLLSTVIGAIFQLVYSPTHALIFLVLFLIISQINANLIYTYVVGKYIKIPSIWVLIAIAIGGGLAGVTGMFLSVPIFSVIYNYIKVKIYNKLDERNLSVLLADDNSSEITENGSVVAKFRDRFFDRKPISKDGEEDVKNEDK